MLQGKMTVSKSWQYHDLAPHVGLSVKPLAPYVTDVGPQSVPMRFWSIAREQDLWSRGMGLVLHEFSFRLKKYEASSLSLPVNTWRGLSNRA
jgi:hypothetical protein